jgi:hypothetical protein
MRYLCTRRKLGLGRSCMPALRGCRFGPMSVPAAKLLITHSLGVSLNARPGLAFSHACPRKRPMDPRTPSPQTSSAPLSHCYYFICVIEEGPCHWRAGAKNGPPRPFRQDRSDKRRYLGPAKKHDGGCSDCGGRIQNQIKNINSTTRNVFSTSASGAKGFAPPWYPSTTVNKSSYF